MSLPSRFDESKSNQLNMSTRIDKHYNIPCLCSVFEDTAGENGNEDDPVS
jgi:hypothetical protein